TGRSSGPQVIRNSMMTVLCDNGFNAVIFYGGLCDCAAGVRRVKVSAHDGESFSGDGVGGWWVFDLRDIPKMGLDMYDDFCMGSRHTSFEKGRGADIFYAQNICAGFYQ